MFISIKSDINFHDSAMSVTNQLALTWNRTLDLYVGKKVLFSGAVQILKSRSGCPSTDELANITFSEDGWILSPQLSVSRLPRFIVESASDSLLLMVSAAATSVPPIELVSLVNATVKFDLSFASPPSSTFTGQTLVSAAAVDLSVDLIHPFADYDAPARSVFAAVPPVAVNSYCNCSICLSTDGEDDCGLRDPFFLRERSTPGVPFTIPPGFRYSVHTSIDGAAFEIAATSARVAAITAAGRGLSLRLADAPPDLALGLSSAAVTITDTAALSVADLSLSAVSLASSTSFSLTVAGTAQIDMDVFDSLIRGIFSGGRLRVLGTLVLSDTDNASLSAVVFSSGGCTLQATLAGAPASIAIPQDHFDRVIVGVRSAFPNDFRTVNLTTDGSGSVRGNVTIRIDSANVYLVIGAEWSRVSLIARRVVLDASVGRGRVVFDASVAVAALFDARPPIGLIEEQTAPSCFFGVGAFPACLAFAADLRPVACAADVCVSQFSAIDLNWPRSPVKTIRGHKPVSAMRGENQFKT
jgi:hypothetical protein